MSSMGYSKTIRSLKFVSIQRILMAIPRLSLPCATYWGSISGRVFGISRISSFIESINRNKGVIIAGPKGAGKTTLLLHALRNEATKYLSSDRVLVSFTDTGTIFRGMPTIPSILPSTLELFPDFRESLLSSYFHYWLTIYPLPRLK